MWFFLVTLQQDEEERKAREAEEAEKKVKEDAEKAEEEEVCMNNCSRLSIGCCNGP